MNTATKAAALRWFAERVGREVTTVQVRPDGMTWEPGARTVQRKGADSFRLDDSTMRITADHNVLDVTDSMVRIEWVDEDGVTINVTTYRDLPIEDEDEDEDV